MAKARKRNLKEVGQPISVRDVDKDGVVHYVNNEEAEFAFVLDQVQHRNLSALDDVLDAQEFWATEELARARRDILEYRHEALAAYRNKNSDLAMALGECAFLGAEIAKLWKHALPRARSKLKSERNLKGRGAGKPTPEKTTEKYLEILAQHQAIRKVGAEQSARRAVVAHFSIHDRTVKRHLKQTQSTK